MEEKPEIKMEEINIDTKSNLPIERKDPSLMRKAQAMDGLKRAGRAAGGLALGFGILTVAAPAVYASNLLIGGAVGTAVANTITAAASISCFWPLVRGLQNIVHQTQDDLMFMGRRALNGELKLYQDLKLNLASHMKGFSPREKAGMMILQALVGFSRFKDNLEGTPYQTREDGTRVFDQEFSTMTHSVNLKAFTAMEKMGLIEIVKKEDKLKKNIFTGERTEKKGLLIFEKLGFKNNDAIKRIAKATFKRDKETLETEKYKLEKWTFKLTDKPVNFMDICLKAQGLIPCESEEEKNGIKTFRVIFGSKSGLLAKRNIDIGKDRFGRDCLLYDQEKPFMERLGEEYDLPALRQRAYDEGRLLNMPYIRAKAKAERESEFDREIKEGVDADKLDAFFDEQRAKHEAGLDVQAPVQGDKEQNNNPKVLEDK